MKKFLTRIPLQGRGNLQKMKYTAVDHEKLQMDNEVSFPILTAVNGYVQENEELEILAEYLVEKKDIRSNEKIEKHAEWAEVFLPKYPKITEENVMDILKEEVGITFVHVLEDAGVYKCTPEGREAFMRFINTL